MPIRIREPKPKLSIELVPSSSWYTNVRSQVSKQEWDTIRRKVYKAANYQCEICGGVGNRHPVECHEVWNYNEKTHIQKLVRMIALCPACHEVKHIGLAQIRGRLDAAVIHMASVNKWTMNKAREYVMKAFTLWNERSQIQWELDLSNLDPYLT